MPIVDSDVVASPVGRLGLLYSLLSTKTSALSQHATADMQEDRRGRGLL